MIEDLPDKAKKRAVSQTQWAAQFAVASELCKRGYEVSFTMGNHTPLADLLVINPKDKGVFLIDVKGLYKKNPFVVRRKADTKNLYYIFTFVPKDQPNQFFILTQVETNACIKSELDRLGRQDDYPMTGISWSQALTYKDKWTSLPKPD